MEFMPGGNLQQLITKVAEAVDAEAAEAEAVNIVRQILQGIAIMHSRHIIHRDLKPAVSASLSRSRVLNIYVHIPDQAFIVEHPSGQYAWQTARCQDHRSRILQAPDSGRSDNESCWYAWLHCP